MAGDIDIALRRSLDNGQTWEPLQILANLEKDACGNPCVVRDESNGRLWLTFTRSRGQDTEEQIVAATVPGTRVYVIHSDDQGATWTQVNNTGGLITRPFYYTTLNTDPTNADIVYAGAEGLYKSTDGGATWKLRATRGS